MRKHYKKNNQQSSHFPQSPNRKKHWHMKNRRISNYNFHIRTSQTKQRNQKGPSNTKNIKITLIKTTPKKSTRITKKPITPYFQHDTSQNHRTPHRSFHMSPRQPKMKTITRQLNQKNQNKYKKNQKSKTTVTQIKNKKKIQSTYTIIKPKNTKQKRQRKKNSIQKHINSSSKTFLPNPHTQNKKKNRN